MNGLIASAKKIEEYGALLDCVKNTRLPIYTRRISPPR